VRTREDSSIQMGWLALKPLLFLCLSRRELDEMKGGRRKAVQVMAGMMRRKSCVLN